MQSVTIIVCEFDAHPCQNIMDEQLCCKVWQWIHAVLLFLQVFPFPHPLKLTVTLKVRLNTIYLNWKHILNTLDLICLFVYISVNLTFDLAEWYYLLMDILWYWKILVSVTSHNELNTDKNQKRQFWRTWHTLLLLSVGLAAIQVIMYVFNFKAVVIL